LAIQKGKQEVEGWRVRKNGVPFYVTGVLTAIRDDDQKLIGFASGCDDPHAAVRKRQPRLKEMADRRGFTPRLRRVRWLTTNSALTATAIPSRGR
jgi:hypothetical protein